MKEENPQINPLKNGPLQVNNLQKFTNSRGEAIETKQAIFLCRCGASKTKPFCEIGRAHV